MYGEGTAEVFVSCHVRRLELKARVRGMLVSDRVIPMGTQAKLDHVDLQGQVFAAGRGAKCQSVGAQTGSACSFDTPEAARLEQVATHEPEVRYARVPPHTGDLALLVGTPDLSEAVRDVAADDATNGLALGGVAGSVHEAVGQCTAQPGVQSNSERTQG